MLVLDYDITRLKGADYNPRHIDDGDLDMLCESVKTLGVVKPIIARVPTIVAGHQRSKACIKNGDTKQPVFLLSKDTNIYDEIRFNQLHNGTDMDSGDENAKIKGGFDKLGYQVVEDANLIEGNLRSRLAVVRGEIAKLIAKYGPWGGVVATKSGEIIHCAQYALAAKLTRSHLTVYVVEDSDKALYQRYLNKSYGVFSYEKLKRQTYIQTLAQMNRLKGTGQLGSVLYDSFVIPYLAKLSDAKSLSMIDFGSGKGAYAKKMRQEGYRCDDVELFRRFEGKNAFNVSQINRMIDKMCKQLEREGGYDIVICDSVFNSVDSLDAQTAVCTMLNALCKPGGHIFFSGRTLENLDYQLETTRSSSRVRRIEFNDKDGFTALYRQGRWFYQKYHDQSMVMDLAKEIGVKVINMTGNKNVTSWQCLGEKEKALDDDLVRWATEFEFNMALNDKGRRINRHEDVISALGL